LICTLKWSIWWGCSMGVTPHSLWWGLPCPSPLCPQLSVFFPLWL
jgi:hypothetical protein